LTPLPAVVGHFAMNVTGRPGYFYVVQASTNLANWISIGTNGSPFDFVDADSGSFSKRFYRAYLPASEYHSDTTNEPAADHNLLAGHQRGDAGSES